MNGAVAGIIDFPLPTPDISAGVSASAGYTEQISDDVENDLYLNYLFLVKKTKQDELIENLNNLYEESLEGNIDNYGALPIKLGSHKQAHKFIKNFPVVEILPDEILSEPDGSVAFQWDNEEAGSTFAVSFAESGEINYSGIFEDNSKNWGVLKFEGFWIPPEILSNIIRTISGKKQA
ncbi:MAG: hypothetical protein V3S46_04160 [Nitrospinota bacterium]